MLIFIRYLSADRVFSYDYEIYILIIDRLSQLSFSEMLGENLKLPYVRIEGTVPVEVGFAFVAKCVSRVFSRPEVSYAVMASASVALRVYVMMLLKVPRLWIIALNIFPIILFESNAIRLGMAAGILLFGLQKTLDGKRVTGLLSIFLSLTFHLQVAIFVLPFAIFYIAFPWITRNKLYVGFILVLFTLGSIIGSNFIAQLPIAKLADYLKSGSSASAGLSITSGLSIAMLVSSAFMIRINSRSYEGVKPFSAILAACVPSLVMFVYVTNIAAIGDRAWQLAFVIFSAFFFSDWTSQKRRRLPLMFFVLLVFSLVINAIYRYPLSNFFSPPFPSIDFDGHF